MIKEILDSIPHHVIRMAEVDMIIPVLINKKMEKDKTIEERIDNYLESNKIDKRDFFSGAYDYTLKDIIFIEDIINMKLINL